MAMSPDKADAFFTQTSVWIDGNPNLRIPQIEGYEAAAQHLAGRPLVAAIEQIPVGCGKT